MSLLVSGEQSYTKAININTNNNKVFAIYYLLVFAHLLATFVSDTGQLEQLQPIRTHVISLPTSLINVFTKS